MTHAGTVDVDGWRVCYTRPAERQLTLYSPIYGTHKQGVRSSTCFTRDRIMRGVCPLQDHAAPAPGCACGVYAVANVVDGLYRLRAMTMNIRNRAAGSQFPCFPDSGMVPILSRVELHRAAGHDDKGMAPILTQFDANGHERYLPLGIWSRVKQVDDLGRKTYVSLGTSIPVIRAASAEIRRVFVTAELIGAEAAIELANRLAASLDVEAVAGFPEFTARDWDTRPDWMSTEPWRSLYAVDAVMSCFTREVRPSTMMGIS